HLQTSRRRPQRRSRDTVPREVEGRSTNMPQKNTKSVNNSQSNLRPGVRAVPSPLGDSPPPEVTRCTPPLAVDLTELKSELLHALRNDVTAIFKTELQAALSDNLTSIKSELLTLKTDLSVSISSMKSDVAGLKATVTEMEQSLSTCSDDIAALQNKVYDLSKECVRLDNKCEDLESRARRQNIRIIGVPEDDPASLSAAGVSKLLVEAFKLDKEPIVDRAHRALRPKPKPGEHPRAIIAKLHYYTDCADILRKARELQRIKVRNMTISVFPDHTARTARARAAFNNVRRQLREIEGVRFGLLHPARLRITHGGQQRDFTSLGEAMAFIKTLKKDTAP
uniref:L1 transposable element RRM domain-containing protein n=1 Tax=Acanthochromis polyacanthus TaxID=80966 RepID=A0A3Q1GC67_9TELE